MIYLTGFPRVDFVVDDSHLRELIPIVIHTFISDGVGKGGHSSPFKRQGGLLI